MFESELSGFLSTLGPDEPEPWMVDKDYWLTRVLRRLSEEMGDAFIFKGGTSLSMGYALIDRFSEDIDLLFPDDNADEAINEALAVVVDELGSEPEIRQEGDAYKFAMVPFPATERAPARLKNMRTIRLDLGGQGGTHPSEQREISPVIRRLLKERDLDADEDDLQPFSMRVLHPARTCLEKLEAVHGAALKLLASSEVSLTSRDGKHPYDVYKILDHPPTVELLANDTERSVILESIDHANQRWFGQPSQRPEAGYADSPAFSEGATSESFEKATMSAIDNFLWRNAEAPAWTQIVERIIEKRALF